MMTDGIDKDFIHHGLVTVLNVLAMALTLLVIAYGLINPPPTLFPLSDAVIASAPQASKAAAAARQNPTEDARGPHAAEAAASGARAGDARECEQGKGIASDCIAP